MNKNKTEIVTFKADKSLLEAMKGIPNRSEFIRTAVLNALESACPLCRGTGIMTPAQKEHWELFAKDHAVEECRDCHELHLVCSRTRKGKR
nr:CopG family transcriptional regulator [candidate division Zixibacteria bacterium]